MVSTLNKDAINNPLSAIGYGYDPQGRMNTTTDARTGTTTSTFDNDDRVVTVTTPAPGDGSPPQTTTTLYDDLGRVNGQLLPDSGATTNLDYAGLAVWVAPAKKPFLLLRQRSAFQRLMNGSNSIVSLKAVADYDPARIESAMHACLEPLGGMGAFVRPGQRVLLKPNLIGTFPADRAATTHPAVVRAAIRLAQKAGGRVRVGDSPGMGTLERAVQVCGLAPVLAETGAELADCSVPHEFEAGGNVMFRRLTLARILLETDVVISLPKLKTHAQMTFTGALKNQYGLIPGALKGHWHFRLQQPEWLAALILDVNRAARPALAIMDAVIGMEGMGPTGGKPRRVGALIAGADLASVDTLACHLIGLDPLRVPLLAAARQQGYGRTALESVPLAGDDWRAVRVPDFEKVEQVVDLLRILPLPQGALRGIRRLWAARPRIVNGKCTRCGVCEKGCPVSGAAIHPKSEPGRQVEDDRCIACYCCHEFCPHQAIELVQPWLTRWLPMTAMANGAAKIVGMFGSGRRRSRSSEPPDGARS